MTGTDPHPAEFGRAAHEELVADLAGALRLTEGLAQILGGPATSDAAAGASLAAPTSGGVVPGHDEYRSLVADLAAALRLERGLHDVLAAEGGHAALVDDLTATIDITSGLAKILYRLAPVTDPSTSPAEDGSGLDPSLADLRGFARAATADHLRTVHTAPDHDRLHLRAAVRPHRSLLPAMGALDSIRRYLTDAPTAEHTDPDLADMPDVLTRQHDLLAAATTALAEALPRRATPPPPAAVINNYLATNTRVTAGRLFLPGLTNEETRDRVYIHQLYEAAERGDPSAPDALRTAAAQGGTTALHALALLRERAGDWEGARDLYREAIARGDNGALRPLADVLMRLGDQDSALRLYREADDRGTLLGDLSWLRDEADDRPREYIDFRLVGDLGVGAAAVATAVLPDGRVVAVTGDHRGGSGVWDLATCGPVGEPLGVRGSWVTAVATAVLPDGRVVAVTGDDFGGVEVWDLATGGMLGKSPDHPKSRVTAVATAVLPDGRVVAVIGHALGQVRVWLLAADSASGERPADSPPAVGGDASPFRVIDTGDAAPPGDTAPSATMSTVDAVVVGEADGLLRRCAEELGRLDDRLLGHGGAMDLASRWRSHDLAEQLADTMRRLWEVLSDFRGADLRPVAAEAIVDGLEDLDGVRWSMAAGAGGATRWPPAVREYVIAHSVAEPGPDPEVYVIRLGAAVGDPAGR